MLQQVCSFSGPLMCITFTARGSLTLCLPSDGETSRRENVVSPEATHRSKKTKKLVDRV